MVGENQSTRVGIDAEGFTIDSQPTYEGRTQEGNAIEGLLFNPRLVHT